MTDNIVVPRLPQGQTRWNFRDREQGREKETKQMKNREKERERKRRRARENEMDGFSLIGAQECRMWLKSNKDTNN